ncbi:DJ-1/PfpI family protein [Loktanella sp. D2R18]|uniref:DJ-1/PfpI family protein n=1 Tax=Rhodobacterales TaxID=204455 RepID=UPI000DE81A40|nr:MULTISPECIES: DJ-1/PfpI family protein [Rhodobacterales]MDO6590608.1 DJ-1/PfpI family protein [Yoonia sp. 1_MG-2023]RBW44761.1 DJ-1/PfpI family protein [Loktanella sp. D2R18]
MSAVRSIGAVVFDGFETLDLFGPLQMFGTLADHFGISIVAEQHGLVTSRHGQKLSVEHAFDDCQSYDLILVPGGPGTWDQIDNNRLLNWLQDMAPKSEHVLSVCTGAAFLAKAGLLDGRAATTNKLNFDWVTQFGPNVDWQGRARWVEDGAYFTSSGVSAGMDMSLAVIEHLLGAEQADFSATHSEYERQRDPKNDPFALQFGIA